MFLWRELGVLKSFRQDVSAFLSLPLFIEALSKNYEAVLLSTNLASQGFKWGLGMGLFPIHFFMIDKLILMGGSIKYAASIFEEILNFRQVKKKAMVD